MADQLEVVNVPFQGSLDITEIATDVPSSLEMFFVNNGYTVLIVNNADMADNDVTIVSVPGDVPGTPNLVATVTGETTRIFGPFQPLWWNQAGFVYVTFESDTTVTVAALNLQF